MAILRAKCDAAFRQTSGLAGLGVVVYVDKEQYYFQKGTTRVTTSQEAETLALRYTLKRIMNEWGKDNVVLIEVDNFSLAKRINELLDDDALPRTKNEEIIILLMRKFKMCGVKWIDRGNNKMAHKLSQQAIKALSRELNGK
ncbi:reverse transcriptase-like protein [Enterococcus faecium]|nr:reverse transcriptase-like protein [Enterococcus faecium]